jgi:hypothetical protein
VTSRRHLPLVLLPLLVLPLLLPARQTSAISFDQCTVQDSVTLSGPTPVDGTAAGALDVSCARYPARSLHGTGGLPPDGTDCSYIQEIPVTVTVQGDQVTTSFIWNNRDHNNIYSRNDAADQHILDAPPGQQVYMLINFVGTFQGGQCIGGYDRHNTCWAIGGKDAGLHGPLDCMSVRPTPTGASALPGVFADVLGWVRQSYHIGTIGSAPQRQGLTQLDSCFWLQGAQAPGPGGTTLNQLPLFQVLRLVVLGPNGIIYTLLVRLTSGGLQWRFGDPRDPQDTQDGSPSAECQRPANGLPVTAHKYLVRSDIPGVPPDGFHVTTSLSYDVTATEYWFDPALQVPQAVNLGRVGGLTLTAPIYAFKVIQEEGVPIFG